MIFEIRDYTIENEWFDEYVIWAENHFIPFVKKRIVLIDFWVNTGVEAEIDGSDPIITRNGQPNVTWIAMYNDKNERDEFYKSLKSDKEWNKIWGKHPKQDSYLHENSRFFKSIIK
ncbi:MAG: hypothetical protein CMQ83_04530 [Gammaproteobacteria bacterium]|nr:hypothetical protein [Gammaproteobacteria bacterium]|tara:strand:- start:1102 stop:1449 length:348 start_codon:yes stop_codon:yes gene_type:complete